MDHYITAHQLGRRWQLAPKTLEKWRYKGLGPQYVKVGSRVLYRMSDILSFERQGLRVGNSIIPSHPVPTSSTAEVMV